MLRGNPIRTQTASSLPPSTPTPLQPASCASSASCPKIERAAPGRSSNGKDASAATECPDAESPAMPHDADDAHDAHDAARQGGRSATPLPHARRAFVPFASFVPLRVSRLSACNVECRNQNVERSPNDECRNDEALLRRHEPLRHSSFKHSSLFRHSSFDIRHSPHRPCFSFHCTNKIGRAHV